MDEQNLTTKKKKKWLLPTIIAVIVVIAAISAIIVYNLPANRLNRQLVLAEKYMSELNYDAAILAYKAAIEIDPRCEKAYVGLVDLYIAMGDYDNAEEVVAQAENNLDAEAVLALKEKTRTLLALDDIGVDNENTNTEETETSVEETSESEPYLRYMQATSFDSEGNITSIEKDIYDVYGNVINVTFYAADGTEYSSWEYQYDENDNRIMSAHYDENKQLTSKTEYDSNGNVLININYNENGDIEQHIENTYDENGNNIKFISYFSDGSIETQVEYDTNGNILGRLIYDENGNVASQIACEYENDGSIHISELTKDYETNSLYVAYEYFYDSNWNVLKEFDYDESGEIYKQAEYLYDGEKLITEITTSFIDKYKTEYEYYEDGTLKAQTTYSSYDGEPFTQDTITLYSYDDLGNRTEKYYGYDNTLVSVLVYDKNNIELKAEYYTNGELDDSRESRYDEHGNIVYYIYHSSNYFVEYSWTYKYDDNGNIISMQEYIDTGDGTHLNQEYRHEYDENGNEIKYISYYNNPELDKYSDHSRSAEYEYDENGKLIKETWYYRDNTICDWTEYEYIYE